MDEKPKFSLQQEIKKRKTQELIRQVELRRTTGSMQKVQTGTLRPVDPPVEPKRASQTTAAASDARRSTQTTSAAKRTTQTPSIAAPTQKPLVPRRFAIAAVATLLSVIVCISTLMIATNPGASQTPTPRPLPLASANDVVNYLKKAGVGITSLQSFRGASSPWHAYQQLQFTTEIDKEKSVVILLSYDSADLKVPDVFKTSNNVTFKTWQMVTVSNVIMLMAPETAPALKSAMTSHLTECLLAPYRDFLPTATPAA